MLLRTISIRPSSGIRRVITEQEEVVRPPSAGVRTVGSTMDMGGGGSPAMGPASSDSSTAMSGSSSMFFSTQLPFTLLFSSWVINTSGQLAGAWFACFFLAISFQVLLAISSRLETRSSRKLAMGQPSSRTGSAIDNDIPAEDGTPSKPPLFKWWLSFSKIDMARALLRFIMVCVAYLLMLAVMSFNVAIFFAVTSGIFVGTLFQGSHTYSSATGNFCDVNMTTYGGANYAAPAPESSRVFLMPGPNRTAGRMALLVRAASITFLVLVLVWVKQVEGGLGWVEASLFGWHAFLFTLAVPVFMTESVLAFSAPIFDMVFLFRSWRRQKAAVVLHVSLNIASLICIPLALAAIVYYKKLSDQPVVYPMFTLYSSHSWMGVVTLVIWVCQIISGFYKRFLVLGSPWRQFIFSVHSFLGKVTYVAGLATCASGLEDMQSSDLSGAGYGPHSTFSLMAAAASIVLIFLGMAVFGVLEVRRNADLTTLPLAVKNQEEKDSNSSSSAVRLASNEKSREQ